MRYDFSTAPVNAAGGVDPPNASGLGLTPLSPASAVYTIKTGAGRTRCGFRYTVPYSSDANVKSLYVWISHNGAPYVIMAIGWPQAAGAMANSPGLNSVFLS